IKLLLQQYHIVSICQQALQLLDIFFLFFSMFFLLQCGSNGYTSHVSGTDTSNLSSIVIPILRAVPSTMRIAASTSAAFKSSIFDSAISFTVSRLTVATFVLFGSPDALSIPAAFFNKTAAGGVFVINVNERSSNTVISTGIIKPALSCVCALNSLQNPMILIPA